MMKNKKRGATSYTVMVLPNPTSKTFRFSLTGKQVKSIIGGLTLVSVLFAYFSIHFFLTTSELVELSSLRNENRTQKVEIQTLSSRITDLNKKMAKLKELDAKIRIIADINPPQEVAYLPGQGGYDEESMDSVTSFVGKKQTEVLQTLQRDISRLEEDAMAQEVSFVELETAMTDKRTLWASTPSIKPVRGWVTSGFGKRVSPFTGHLTMHKGLDIASRQGTPIVSPADGVVSYEGYNSGLGKLIKINHGYGIQTVYGHLSKTKTSVGQKIKRGDVIGYVGNTGMSTGPHLHYAIYVNNVPVNPMRYILN